LFTIKVALLMRNVFLRYQIQRTKGFKLGPPGNSKDTLSVGQHTLAEVGQNCEKFNPECQVGPTSLSSVNSKHVRNHRKGKFKYKFLRGKG
jgi:hypothetical protein